MFVIRLIVAYCSCMYCLLEKLAAPKTAIVTSLSEDIGLGNAGLNFERWKMEDHVRRPSIC